MTKNSGSGADQSGRDETKAERADRNWIELLQELRVTQTGVQLLTGLLLTLPFQDRFLDLDQFEKTLYLAIVIAAVSATGLLIAPVAFHRILFREGEKDWLVRRGNFAANAGLGCLAVATSGAVWLIFDVVTNRVLGTVVAAATLAMFAVTWWVAPVRQRID
jgi:hypothetical protein